MSSTVRGQFFQPTAADFDGVWQGVPFTWFQGEPGDVLAVALTTDRDGALTAFNAYLADDDVEADPDRVELVWARFEKQPAGARHTWLAHQAEPGNPEAVQVHFLFYDA